MGAQKRAEQDLKLRHPAFNELFSGMCMLLAIVHTASGQEGSAPLLVALITTCA